MRTLYAQSNAEVEALRRDVARSAESTALARTQAQAEEARLRRDLQELQSRAQEEAAQLRANLSESERKCHSLELDVLRNETLRSEVDELRRMNERLAHEKEASGALSPTLVRFLVFLFFFVFLLKFHLLRFQLLSFFSFCVY